MSLNVHNDQAEKTKATPPTKASFLTSDQLEVTEDTKEKTRKEKKRKGYQEKQDRREGQDSSLVATGANTTQATESQKKKRRNG